MSYYKEQIPELIEQIKIAMQQCMSLISQEIDPTLNDDKLHAALKGKRVAVEDVKFYAKEIDALQNEMLGIELESNETRNFAKERASAKPKER